MSGLGPKSVWGPNRIISKPPLGIAGTTLKQVESDEMDFQNHESEEDDDLLVEELPIDQIRSN